MSNHVHDLHLGFQRLLAEEKAQLLNKEGWKIYKKTPDYEVWKKHDPILRADLIKVSWEVFFHHLKIVILCVIVEQAHTPWDTAYSRYLDNA